MEDSLIINNSLNDSFYDVIIIGSGIAGLYTALTLEDKYNVMLITKDKLYESNSNYAQGGIAAALEESDFENHVRDTLNAGSNYNDKDTVKTIISEARENILKLVEFGVNFDLNEDGNFRRTKEGGHSNSRILHYKDSTGREIIRALTEAVKNKDSVKCFENTFAIDLIKENGKVNGVLLQKDNLRFKVNSSKVIIASGGIGKLFKNSTNSLIATGDGIAMALKSNAKVLDMEFIQFHPTALNFNENQNFLISEALRGEGAVLRNNKGERFMEKYHHLLELAPRDIVSQSIFTEMQKDDISDIFLDITGEDSEYVKNRFPQIYEYCLKFNIDITKEYIPVIPVQHYLMGGIEVDLKGKTSIENLYACGEVSRTGLHGANRLASNSLLEAIVTGSRISKDINKNLKVIKEKSKRKYFKVEIKNSYEYEKEIEEIRNIMSSNVFIVRYLDRLKESLKSINELIDSIENNNSIKYYEVMNMLIVSKRIIEDSINRKESLGSHKIIV